MAETCGRVRRTPANPSDVYASAIPLRTVGPSPYPLGMDEQQAPKTTPPGWYPDPVIAGTQRFWDGERWTDNVAPMQSGSQGVSPQLIAGLVVAASVVGVILSQQSVTVMSGSGIVWTGAAICAGAAVVTWVVKTTPVWARGVCILLAALAIVSAVSVENELNDRREEISNLIGE